MKMIFRFIFFVAVVSVPQFVFISSPSGELIEPTRKIGKQAGEISKLTVLSEPPGLTVVLDGDSLGKTPAFLKEVKPGIHTLKVKDSETEIYLAPGKTLQISLFKNEFVQIPDAAVTPQKKPQPEQQKTVSAPEPVKSSFQEERTQENREQAKKRWMRFVDGTLPAF